jgi:hypothetical protein
VKKRRRNKTWKHWTNEDDLVIIENYNKCSCKELGLKLDRSEGAVSLRIRFLVRLKKVKKWKFHSRRWTPQEDGILRKLYGSGIPASVVGQRCNNRKDDAVRHRASVLGIKSPNYNVSVFIKRCTQQIHLLDKAIQKAEEIAKKGSVVYHGYPDKRDHKTGVMTEIKNGRDFLSAQQVLTHDFIRKIAKRAFRDVQIIWYPFASRLKPETGRKLKFKNYRVFRKYLVEQLRGKRHPRTGEFMY